jgi:hypothetical protein
MKALAALTSAVLLATAAPALAEPVAVKFTEGIAHAFPVLRSVGGEKLAQGELVQIPHGDVVENRLTFRFRDGSLYDERVVFSQREAFTLMSYQIVQRGPSFPESIDAKVDRETGRYEVRYKGDDDAAEELLKGKIELPNDVYNGLLGMLMKNMPAGSPTTVQIIAFTPKPRLVKMLLTPAGSDTVMMGETAVPATRFLIKPQLGLFASLLVADLPDVKVWICGGEAPAFLRFEGPLFFMGPIWKIDWT